MGNMLSTSLCPHLGQRKRVKYKKKQKRLITTKLTELRLIFMYFNKLSGIFRVTNFLQRIDISPECKNTW